jgi:hypothetical protein
MYSAIVDLLRREQNVPLENHDAKLLATAEKK